MSPSRVSVQLVEVTLSEEDYETLQEIIQQKQAYNYVTDRLKNLWIWTVVAGLIGVFSFWDTVKTYLFKVT